jgi:hypothetical protein
MELDTVFKENIPIKDLRLNILNYYSASKWVVISAPAGTINDVIASKGNRLHFVKIINTHNKLWQKQNVKNTFIQNAFSNGAIPVYAYVVENPESHKCKINFININTETKINMSNKEKKLISGS